jgi:hypothetical protein
MERGVGEETARRPCADPEPGLLPVPLTLALFEESLPLSRLCGHPRKERIST